MYHVITEPICFHKFLEAMGKPMLPCVDMHSTLCRRSFITIENKDDIDRLIQEMIKLVEEDSELRIFPSLRVVGVVEDSLSLM